MSGRAVDYLAGLNEAQTEAVQTTEGYVRVIAGAGSGKTKLLVSRYAYLVEEAGIDTANILCVTFTNKAAGEMKKRIRALIGPAYDTNLICTYHGFCARLLREDAGKLFMEKGFRIIDTTEQKRFLAEIFKSMELRMDHASFESILRKLSIIKATTDYVPRMCDPRPCRILPENNSTDHQILEAFLQRQKATFSLDFHDLIHCALYLLETNATVREKWQERLSYIMVDEFQDSSVREMKLVDILSDHYRNVMIVGDPDQNIYEWRGSDVRLLVDFDKSHTPTETIFLNRNYRSTPEILRCANHLIEKNKIRIKKDLFTLSPAGASVTHYHSKSDDAEAAQIARIIRDMQKEKNRPFADFAVLYRSGFLSRAVEKKLTEAHIPYEIYGGVRFWERMEVLDLVAYLKLIAYDDDESFSRVINTPRRKIGRSKQALIAAWRDGVSESCETEDVTTLLDGWQDPSDPTAPTGYPTLFSALAAHTDHPALSGSGAAAFVRFILDLRARAPHMRISEIVHCVSEASGYEQYIRELGDEERLENLGEFKRVADEFEKSFGEDLSLDAFLQQVALQAGEGNAGDKPRDAVRLMTIHASKGLEFPIVFVVGFTEGIFPSGKTIEERKNAGLEEERRLCYVAITRAKEQLFLMDSEGFSENGVKKLPSRFLREIGVENYIRIGKISDELEKESQGHVARTSPPVTEAPHLAPGTPVDHHIFGHGVIVSYDEKRGSYAVKFDRLDKPRQISGTYFTRQTEESRQTDTSGDAQTATPASKNVPEPPPAATPASKTVPEPPPAATPVSKTVPEPLPAATPVSKTVPEPLPHVEPKPVPSPARDTHSALDMEAMSADRDNLWKRDDVPHEGWVCTGISDLGQPVGICAMCGYQIIRYVHHMEHPHYRPLGVGCVCAGKMEGDIQAAKLRERTFKNREARRESFLHREWKKSKNGNLYLKIKGHVVVLCETRNGGWRFSVDRTFDPGIYAAREEAVSAAFNALDALLD